MASFNRVLLIGNLTRDPELRYTPSGTPVTNLRLAVNSTYKDQSGQRKEETCFLTVVVWNKPAEACHQYLKKGRAIFVEGRLIYRSWEAEGKTRSTLEVRADRVQFLGGPSAQPAGVREPVAQVAGASGEPVTEGSDAEPAAESGAEEDVPF